MILEAIQDNSTAILYTLAGTILGAVLIGALVGGIGDAIGGAIKRLRNIGDVGAILNRLKSVDIHIPDNVSSTLAKLSKTGVDSDVALKVAQLIDVNPTILSRLTGSLDDLTPTEVLKVFQLADKLPVDVTDVKPLLRLLDGDLSKLSLAETTDAIALAKKGKLIDSDTYTSFKSSKGNSTLSSFLVSQELDNIKRSGNYDLLDTDHTILGDFNPNGTFKSGGHYYEVMDNYIKKGLVEAFADPTGRIPITNLSDVQPSSGGVVSIFVKEYKSGNVVIRPKTITPQNMELKNYLDIGNDFIAESRLVPGHTTLYENIIMLNGEVVLINGRITESVRTWYFTI